MCVDMLGLLFTQHYNDSYLLCYYFVHVALFVVHIRAWTICSHFMLGCTFYVTFIPVTVCECHTELKAIT